MIRNSLLLICTAVLFILHQPLVFSQEEGNEAKSQETVLQDCPGLSSMPNYYISEGDDKEFDSYDFYDGKSIVAVEGKLCKRHYMLKEGATSASMLQIRRNYANAIKKAGGKLLFEGRIEAFDDTRANGELIWGKLTKGTAERWFEIYPMTDGWDYWVTTIEKQAMKQDVKADDILSALNTDGHIALYITFDVNKATIKPESEPIIEQIVSMLRDNPKVDISVEGHTDNTGDSKKNQTLSEERAAAVKAAIVSAGIDAKRLVTVGWGDTKPIADNSTEDGKAKNRRVELVKK
jgi:OOP family OmpA-OmpF porin